MPVQLSATSHAPAAAWQTVPAAVSTSAGQAAELPVQVSATSHAPAASRQTMPAARGAQVPSTAAPAATLHAWQSLGSPPPHAVSQQTPSVQKPLAQSAFVVQASPLLLLPDAGVNR